MLLEEVMQQLEEMGQNKLVRRIKTTERKSRYLELVLQI